MLNIQYTGQLLLRETPKTVNIFITVSDLSQDSSRTVHRKESFNFSFVYFHIYIPNVFILLVFISKGISCFYFGFFLFYSADISYSLKICSTDCLYIYWNVSGPVLSYSICVYALEIHSATQYYLRCTVGSHALLLFKH